MEDFEFSVEICDRDWQCFYEACEECSLRPPLLATAYDSGLSDGDDKKYALVETTQTIEQKGSFQELDYSLNSTATYTHNNFSVKTGLGQQTISGMESILSGSEEDIHLQSVNMFFEGLRESKVSNPEEVNLCRNGLEACCDQPARDKTIVGKGNDISEINTVKKAWPGSELKTDKTFIRGCIESGTNQSPPHQPCDLPDGSVCSERKEADISQSCHPRKRDHKEDPPGSNSPLTSVKKKRKRKRRLSVLSAQSGYDRHTNEEQDLTSCLSSTGFVSQTEEQKMDLLVTNDLNRVILPCGSPCQDKSRRDEHKDDLLSEEYAYGVCFIPLCCDAKLNLEGSKAEVKSVTDWDCDDGDAVEGCQSDKIYSAKSVLAVEALHSVRDMRTGCQRETEAQQQMELEGHNLDQNNHNSEKADLSFMSDTQNLTLTNTDLQRCKNKGYPMDELTTDFVDLLRHKSLRTKRPSSKVIKETEHHWSCDDESPNLSDGIPSTNKGKTNAESSMSKNPPPSSCCARDKTNTVSPYELNIACSSSPCPNDTRDRSGKTSPTMASHQEADHDTGLLSTKLKFDNESTIPTSRHGHPVFVMSSFWSEMEKLTINDILGLRKKNEEPSDSGFLSEPVESDSLQTGEDTFKHRKAVKSNPVSKSTKCVLLWESEPSPPCDVLPETMKVKSLAGSLGHGSLPKGLRTISKNLSVSNLQALDSESCSKTWVGQSLQTFEERELDYLGDGDTQTSSSSTLSYSFSLTDIFQYFFGRNQDVSSQSATDDTIDSTMQGNSVPETYHHFFSQFDTDTFFYPFVTEHKHKKSLPVKKLDFPEAYEYFFASSSCSDDSSEDEDDESRGPVRVVSRFSQKSGATHSLIDTYENFFSDGDMRDSFFWKMTFSFRNVHLSGRAIQNKRSSPLSLVPMKQNVQSLAKTTPPLRLLGHMDGPDPLVLQREDTISRWISTQPYGYEDLQRAVPNPRTNASVLPCRQSDMCLVCIAFASWLLKTANPQVGDTWKAVLLANISALSAIRYLRKFAKVEVAPTPNKSVLPPSMGLDISK
ncbi:PGC-1 and ERR-induced regulator in muscle protein 1 [Nerophis ophidion]|uniref:PGC-1 and ERR-induced regulator in muscle protein 1 n=1 Tax=Nerophis ophidion TaxID=159077 RepID=UPI002AE0AE8F|nr:PGC-1 and ERR-induced regulator in muscle protein 1 [Nerophis ophidion]